MKPAGRTHSNKVVEQQAKYPRPSYSQLEALCSELKSENTSLKAQVDSLSYELRVQREEHESSQREQSQAAEQLFEALRDFCKPQPQAPAHNVLTTPRLGVESRSASTESTSWAELENKVFAMSARVHNKESPQKSQLGSLEDSRKSPVCRSSLSSFRRSRLSLGGRRDPVGSFGEVVAQIARDRATRQQKLGNQENVAVEPSLTPPAIGHTDKASSLASSFRRCSFGRSPCSSLNHASTATPSAPDNNMVCMHTNMLANMSGNKSSSPCGDSVGNSSVQTGLARSLDIAPLAVGPEDSFNFAEKVLADITPSEKPEGLASLLASVVQKAKSNAVKTISAEVALSEAVREAAAAGSGHSESAPLYAI